MSILQIVQLIATILAIAAAVGGFLKLSLELGKILKTVESNSNKLRDHSGPVSKVDTLVVQMEALAARVNPAIDALARVEVVEQKIETMLRRIEKISEDEVERLKEDRDYYRRLVSHAKTDE